MTGADTGDFRAAAALGVAVGIIYSVTFSTVPAGDGRTWVANLNASLADGKTGFYVISNAPFSYYLVLAIKHLTAPLHLDVATFRIFQGVDALAGAAGSAFFYLILRGVDGARYWSALATGLMAGSYGVWYFADGEVHHAGVAILIFLFYRLMLERRRTEGPVRYGALAGLGALNAVAVFFHQEHFLFGLVAIALLFWNRPWRRALSETVAYGLSGTLGTAILIAGVGWFLIKLHSMGAIVGWYFWQFGDFAEHYQPEALWLVVLRLVKGQATAFLFGAQAFVDAARVPGLLALPAVRLLAALTLAAAAFAAFLAAGLWRGRKWLDGELSALVVGALAWLVVYPALLSWYYPAVTKYYLKTVPALVLLLVAGPLALEHGGQRARGSRAAALALLILLVSGNAWAAIVPWYRYGLMRQRVETVVAATLGPKDLVVSVESGIDDVFSGRTEQIQMKELLRKEGKERGFATARAAIAAHLDAGGRVLVFNLVPSRWTLETLSVRDPLWNPSGDTYTARDFEDLLGQLRARYDVVPIFQYWEEAKEPLYLFGRRLEPILEVRKR